MANAIGSHELLLDPACFSVAFFLDEQIDEIDAVEETDLPASLDQFRS